LRDGFEVRTGGLPTPWLFRSASISKNDASNAAPAQFFRCCHDGGSSNNPAAAAATTTEKANVLDRNTHKGQRVT
jgi:hypothetical protein